MKTQILHSVTIVVALLLGERVFAQTNTTSALDVKVEKFLKDHKREWHDLNVPYEDGQTLHDIIVKNK